MKTAIASLFFATDPQMLNVLKTKEDVAKFVSSAFESALLALLEENTDWRTSLSGDYLVFDVAIQRVEDEQPPDHDLSWSGDY